VENDLTVGVTTHGKRCVWLRDMLNSIHHFSKIKFRLIIVDNASIDDSLDYLSKLAKVRDLIIIRNLRNIDDSGGMNQILSVTESQYLLKVNSDTLLTKEGPVEHILEQMKAREISLIGPYWDLSLRRRKEIEFWEHSREIRNKFNRADEAVVSINPHFEVTTRLPRGNFMLMNVEDVRRVGGFDPRYPHGAMEYSLGMRLLDAGLDYGEFNDESVIHRPSNTLRRKTREKIPDLL